VSAGRHRVPQIREVAIASPGGRGFVSVAKLAASAGASPRKMAVILADFEAAGIAERVGEGWRLTDAAAAKYCPAFDLIEAGNARLEDGDDDGLSHCKPGPAGRGADGRQATGRRVA
jgi:hypothetical protein